jgi:hypothetical protein
LRRASQLQLACDWLAAEQNSGGAQLHARLGVIENGSMQAFPPLFSS